MMSKATRRRAARKAARTRRRNAVKRSKVAKRAAFTRKRNRFGYYATAFL